MLIWRYDFPHFIMNNTFIGNRNTPYPWSPSTVAYVVVIFLTFYCCGFINKLDYFWSVTTVSRTQYKISLGLLPTSWTYSYSANHCSIIPPQRSLLFVSCLNSLVQILCLNIWRSTRNYKILKLTPLVILVDSIIDIFPENVRPELLAADKNIPHSYQQYNEINLLSLIII